MTSWMNSTGHRANILHEDLTKLGVGYTYDGSSEMNYYWVQMFGSGLTEPDTLSTEEILSANMEVGTISPQTSDTTPAALNIDNTVNNTLIQGSELADTISNSGANVTIQAQGGNDSISNYSTNVSIDGGAGNDSVYSYGGSSVTINGGDGNDYIGAYNTSNKVITINGGTGKDTIEIAGNNFLIYLGEGNDSADITGLIQGSDGKTYAGHITIDASAGDDVFTVGASFGIDDYHSSINGGSGNDSMEINGNYVTVECGDGKDSVRFEGEHAILNGGESNDYLLFDGENVTITGGKGNDSVEGFGLYYSYNNGDGWFSMAKDKVTYQYTSGDGDDIIKSFNEKNTISISGGSYSTQSSGNNVIIKVGDDSITLIDAKDKTLDIKGTKTSTGSGSSSSSTQRGGSSTSTITSGTSSTSTTRNTSTAPTLPAYHVYTGGDQVITNYSGEKIILGTPPTGFTFSGGNEFFFGSSTGALVVQEAKDKVIDIRDGNDNPFMKAYAATSSRLIDGRGLGGFEYIVGSDGNVDAIFAGDGGLQLWGGAGVADDTLIGGAGEDLFRTGKTDGNDEIQNAAAIDTVQLYDVTLNDLVAVAENNGLIGLAFNTGGSVIVQSAEALSARFNFADGASFRFNHTTKSWQGT